MDDFQYSNCSVTVRQTKWKQQQKWMSCCRLRDRINYLHIYKNRRKGLGLTAFSVGFGTVLGSQDGLSISFSLLINLLIIVHCQLWEKNVKETHQNKWTRSNRTRSSSFGNQWCQEGGFGFYQEIGVNANRVWFVVYLRDEQNSLSIDCALAELSSAVLVKSELAWGHRTSSTKGFFLFSFFFNERSTFVSSKLQLAPSLALCSPSIPTIWLRSKGTFLWHSKPHNIFAPQEPLDVNFTGVSAESPGLSFCPWGDGRWGHFGFVMWLLSQ